MITEKEYLKAIELIKEYREQVCNHVSDIIDIENDPSKLLKKGTKNQIIKGASKFNIKCRRYSNCRRLLLQQPPFY